MGALFGGGGQQPLAPIQREPTVTNKQAQAKSNAESAERAKDRVTLASGKRVSLISGVLEDERILS